MREKINLKSNIIKNSVEIIFTILCSIVMGYVVLFNPKFLLEQSFFYFILNIQFDALRYSIGFYGISVILIFTLLRLAKYEHQKVYWSGILLSTLFGIVEAVAINFYYFNSFAYSITKKNIAVFDILSAVTYGMIFYSVLEIVVAFTEKKREKNKENGSNKYSLYIKKHIAGISFLLIFVGWLPWLVSFYPGSMWYDMCYQIEQYYGNVAYNLHPVFATWCMGKCLDLGKQIFASDNAGIFIYVLLQAGVCAFAYSRVVTWVSKSCISIKPTLVVLLYFMFFPVFGAYAQYGTKDIMVYGFFTLFFLSTITCYNKIKNNIREHMIFDIMVYIILAVICALYRYEMIIICCIVFFALIVYAMIVRNRKWLIGITAVIISVNSICMGFNDIVVGRIMGIEMEKAPQLLSVPMRQVARFVYYHPDKVSDEEKEILNECFWFGYDEIASKYNPYLSDSLVFGFNNNAERFWNVYISFLKKSPTVYLEGIISSSFAYYAIVPQLPATVNNGETNGTPGERFNFYINRDPDLEYGDVQIAYLDSTVTMREILQKYAYDWRKIPGLCLLYSLGFYTWGFILLVYLMVRQRRFADLIVFIPIALIILVCMVSPANDYMRYFVSVLVVYPCLMRWTMKVESTSVGTVLQQKNNDRLE